MRPEQHPASNSNARKAHAEATDPHGGCKVGTCKAEDQWRTVSCQASVTAAVSLLDAALAAQPAAPQPTEGGELTEAEREAARARDLLSDAQATEVVLRGEIRRSEAALATFDSLAAELALYRKGWAKARAVLAHLADRLDEHSYDEFATVLDDEPADDDLREALAARSQHPEGTSQREVGASDILTSGQRCLIYAGALCDPPHAAQRPERVTVTEWGVREDDGTEYGPWSEKDARSNLICGADGGYPHAVLIFRQRTTFPDVVTEWAEVSGDTEAGGDRG